MRTSIASILVYAFTAVQLQLEGATAIEVLCHKKPTTGTITTGDYAWSATDLPIPDPGLRDTIVNQFAICNKNNLNFKFTVDTWSGTTEQVSTCSRL